ncbi:MAG: dephospho-CoA kinase [Pseudomonadota bacterium]
MLRIGLTGGIGSGKSTVAALFARLGVPVIDTDAISHELTQQNARGYRQIVATFGDGYLGRSGELDRQALREHVFSHPADRRRLEAILHPLIRAEVVQAIGRVTYPYVVIVVPLLIEAGFTDLVDRILVVDTDEQEQIRRTQARSALPVDAIRHIMQTQLDRQSRLAAAHDILHNDADLTQLEDSVQQQHRHYLEIAGKAG